MTARNLKIAVRTLRQLWRYPLRSGLLILMAALGVDGVVCSVNYGAGGTRQILDQIRRMGTNVLIVTPAESRAVAGRARTGGAVTTLVERDYAAIRKTLLVRTRSSALVTASLWVKAGDFSKNAAVVGVEPDYFTIKSWPLAAGELFDGNEGRTGARLAVLGHTVAVDLFGSSPAVGQRVMISRVPFIVAGVLVERGQGLDISNEDNQVYVPLMTAMRRLMNVDHYSGIVIEIDSTNSMNDAAEETRSLLRSLHHAGRNQPDDFQIQNQKTLIDTQMVAASRLDFFLRWIAASALTVSGLGIVAITWIALRERTREIGTRRALGATRSDIFLQVSVETAALAVTGSVVGVAVSWPASYIINESVGLPFVFERDSAAFALAAAITLNLAFSLLPSRKAASVSPLEALRYE
jgi:putative ABC transport system permease protein